MPYDLKRNPRNEAQPAEALRVGEELREARLALGVTLDEVSEQLRINRRYLEALEEGRWRDLPGLAYGAGFIRSYALAMGLDAADVVRRYREAAGPQGRGKDLVFPEPVPDRGVPAGAIVLVGALLAVGGYAAWYQWSGSSERSVDAVSALPPQLEEAAKDAGPLPLPSPAIPPAARPGGATGPAITSPAPPSGMTAGTTAPPPAITPVPLAPSPRPAENAAPASPMAGMGTGSSLPPPVPSAAPAAPSPPPIPAVPAQASAPVAGIVLRAIQECWIQVRDPRGGRVILSRLLRAGETYEVPQPNGLLLTTGRVEALTVEVDGVPSRAFADQVGVRRDVPLDAERLKSAEPGQIPTR